MVAAWAIGGAALGGLLGGRSARKQAEAQAEALRLKKEAALMAYKSAESSVNIMKAAVREETQNAVGEALRAGSENVRQTAQAIKKGSGTLQASQEGLASGQTKAREMATFYVKGNKVMDQVKDQTTGAINQLISEQDKMTNELNNQLLKSYQDMSAVLAQRTPEVDYLGATLGGALKGAQIGMSLGSGFGAMSSAPKTNTTIGPSLGQAGGGASLI
jgi:vacuolar-type H+-ATPase subunit E/Vma4